MNYLQFKCKEKIIFSYHPLMGAILLTSVLLVLLVGTSEALAAEQPAPSIYLPVTIQGISNTVTLPTATPLRGCTPDSKYVDDVTIEDGTILTASTPFTKTWAVRNTGNCFWNHEYSIAFISGDSNMEAISGTIHFAKEDQVISITLPMVAPTNPGAYTSMWQLQYADGAFFGQPLSVVITVVEVTSTTISTPTAALTNTLTVTSTVTVTPTNTPTNTPIPIPTETPTPINIIETATAEVSPTIIETATAEVSPTIIETATAEVQPTNIIETPTAEVSPTASPVPPTDPTDDPITWVLEQFSNPNPLVLAGIGGVLLLIVLIFALLLGRRRRPGGPESPAPTPSGPPPTDPSGLNGVQVPPVMTPPPLGTPYLESLARPAGKVYYPLTQPVIMLGRDDNDHLTIDESFVGWHTVSRKHAKLEREGSNMILVDLNSENGVYVNDLPTGENLLLNDCAIMLGQVQFAFRLNQGGASK